MGLIKVDPGTGLPVEDDTMISVSEIIYDENLTAEEALAAGQVVVPESNVDGHLASLPERYVYTDDGNEKPTPTAVPKAGLGINMAKRQLYTRDSSGNVIPLSIGLHEVKEILKIRDSISSDCQYTESVDGAEFTNIIQAGIGEIVEPEDTVILAHEIDSVTNEPMEVQVVKVLGPNTITVKAAFPPRRVGWTTITRKGRPGDVLIYEGGNSYRVQTPPPEPEVFSYQPLEYEGYGEPIHGALTNNENIRLGRPQTVEESISHAFIYASSALKTIIEAGIKAGLPMQPGMTVSEVVEVLNMIAGVSLQLNGTTNTYSTLWSPIDSGVLSTADLTIAIPEELAPITVLSSTPAVTRTEITQSTATITME